MKTTPLYASCFALGILGLIFAFTPITSFAATEATVSGALPPHTTACPTVGVSDITPYVYDGALDSFEITVTDPNYVAVGGSVGDMPIDFHYMTRSITSDRAVRIHVDIASTPIQSTAPIQVTLLSSRPDTHTTCILSITGEIPGAPSVPNIPTTSTTPSEPSARNPQGSTDFPHSGTTRSHAGSKGHIGNISSTSTITIPKPSTVFVGALSSLGTVCSRTSSWKLWAILLVLYGLFVLVLSAQPRESDTSHGWNSALIVALALALIGLWYFSASCRAGPWAPVVALIIAACGIWMMRDDTVQLKLLLPENKK